MRILYVEDNAVNLSLIARIAQMNKHDLVSHKDAESALAALDAGLTIDLILLDIQLAGEMDGIAFAKILRAQGRTVPIIAITAYAMTGDKERIIAAGCNEYLPKPLPIAEFLTLLAKYDPSVRKSAPEASSDAAPPAETKSQPEAPAPSVSAQPTETKPQSEAPAPSVNAQPTETKSQPEAPTPPASTQPGKPATSISSDTQPPVSQPTITPPPTENKDQNKAANTVGTASRHEGGNPR